MDPRFDKLIENLPFDVVAGPCQQSILDDIPPNSIGTPVNVRIRFRHKDDVHKGVISVPKLGNVKASQKLRLINSDQTIMSFDFLMDSKITDNSTKKPQKKVFKFFKPGICLSSQNDDDQYSYVPNTFENNYTISSATKLDAVSGKQNYDLKKNTLRQPFDSTEQPTTLFLGKCKPGGCLDPPFGEDRYAYEPVIIKNDNDNYQSISVANNSQVPLQCHQTQLHSRSTSKICDPINKINKEFLITYPSNLTSIEDKYINNNLRSSIIDIENSKISNSNIYLQSYYKPPRSRESSISNKIDDGDKQKIIDIESLREPDYTYITKSPSEDSIYRETGCPAEPVLPVKINLSPIEDISSLQTNTDCYIDSEQINESKQSNLSFKEAAHQLQTYLETSQLETRFLQPNSILETSSIKDNSEFKSNNILANGIESHENNIRNKILNERELDEKVSDKQTIVVIAPAKDLVETFNDTDTEGLPEHEEENQQKQPQMNESYLSSKENYNNTHYLESKSDIRVATGSILDNIQSFTPKDENIKANPSEILNKNNENINVLEIKKKGSEILKDTNTMPSQNFEKLISTNNIHETTTKVNDQISRINEIIVPESQSPNLKQKTNSLQNQSIVNQPNLVVDSLHDISNISFIQQSSEHNLEFIGIDPDKIKLNSNNERESLDKNRIAEDRNILRTNSFPDSTNEPSKKLKKNPSSDLESIARTTNSNDNIQDKFSNTIQDLNGTVTKKDNRSSVSINKTFQHLNDVVTINDKNQSNKLSSETADQVHSLEIKSLHREVLRTIPNKTDYTISKSDINESVDPETNFEIQLGHTTLKDYTERELQNINELNTIYSDYNEHLVDVLETKSNSNKNLRSKGAIKEFNINNESFYRDEATTTNKINYENNLESQKIPNNEGDCDLYDFDFALQLYVNSNEVKGFKTIDSTAIHTNDGQGPPLQFNGKLRLDEDEIKLPINNSINIVVSLKKTNNLSSVTKNNQNDILKEENIKEFQEAISLIYEQNLIPVQTMLRALKEEIDILVRNQILIRDMVKTKKSGPPRLVHSNRRCACYRK